MKKCFICLLLVSVLLCTLFVTSACKKNKDVDELVVYNWADYIYDYEDDFKAYYKSLTGRDIKVTYVTFDTNETMLTKILKGDSVVDVVCPSEYAIQKLLEQDQLLPVNYFADDVNDYVDVSSLNGYVHNAENVDSNFVGREDGQYTGKVNEIFSDVTVTSSDGSTKTVNMCDYFVPYMYGTLGILYNKEYFTELGIYDREIMNDANWGILFNKKSDGTMLSDGLTSRIYMKDSIRDSYAATLFYMRDSGILDGKTNVDGVPYTELPIGELINTVDDQLVNLCSKVLKEQKQQLYGYEVDFGKNELLQGIAYVDLAWSGDALYAVEESWDKSYCDPMLEYEDGESGGYKLGYYVPHGSGNIWFDGWVIPKTCAKSHLLAAKLFINFLNRVDVATNNMMEIGYSSAVSPDKIRDDVDCQKILAENYNVYAPELWNCPAEDKCDYASWDEFAEEFFDYVDPIDDSNWRYPFVIDEENEYERSLSDLGVMRDFGANNQKVSAMWEDVRSTGITAWALLLWTLLALAILVGVIALAVFLSRRKKSKVIIAYAGDQQTSQEVSAETQYDTVDNK